MKNINKLSAVVLLLLGLSFTSCETTDLDLLTNPNEITTENASVDRFLTEIQVDFASFMRQMGRNGNQLTRIEYMFGKTYVNNFEPANLDGEWSRAYADMFADMAAAEPLAEEAGQVKHLGVMKILKAYSYMTLVDGFGDVPFSQANQPDAFPAPIVDPGADVYASVIDLLNEGIALVSQEGTDLEADLYYNNDFDKWVKLANTVKMNAYLTTRLVDGGAIGNFNAIANNPDSYISSPADDFEFQYGSTLIPDQLDTRHPAYSADYQVNGAGRYRSNWFMNLMLQNDDPRRKFYFYRQNDCTPGAIGADGEACASDQESLFCSAAPRPVHYPGDMVFCSVDDGYWGRDHGNDQGIPPDTFTRTAVGVYPSGGIFDSNAFGSATVEGGGGGAGILPIMLSSYVNLMRSEMALVGNNPGAASNLLSAALGDSMDKVRPFSNLDSGATNVPTAAEMDAHATAVVNSFNAASGNAKWEILAEQTFIAHYGNGNMNPYNFYRRTGFPQDLQLNLEPNPGGFVRSFFYPANEANVNSNITQKPNVGVQVFWDNNPASPAFPVAN
ncbi:MAG: SusD/RagB family nutrient-binding outer membrane lipoprotein [Bacteroidetes bacterium]|nr:SusD/RagB family nutrient-binding outer membrane lipoprotein [Bacteroidota bacterium]